MVEIPQATEIEPSAFLELDNSDLGGGDVEGFFEAGQTLNVFLSEDEGGCSRCVVLTDQHAYLPELQGAANGIVHAVVLVDRIVRRKERTGDYHHASAFFFRMLFQQELFQSLPAVLSLVERRRLKGAIGEMEGVVIGRRSALDVVAPRGVLAPCQMATVDAVLKRILPKLLSLQDARVLIPTISEPTNTTNTPNTPNNAVGESIPCQSVIVAKTLGPNAPLWFIGDRCYRGLVYR